MATRGLDVGVLGFQGPLDLFEKLLRDAEKLEAEVSSDHLFNFALTARHLAEWMERDRSLAREARRRLARLTQSPSFRLCTELANACKHFTLRNRTLLHSTSSARGFGMGRFGHGGYGIGEEELTLQTPRGSVKALHLVRELVAAFQAVFSSLAPPSDERS